MTQKPVGLTWDQLMNLMTKRAECQKCKSTISKRLGEHGELQPLRVKCYTVSGYYYPVVIVW